MNIVDQTIVKVMKITENLADLSLSSRNNSAMIDLTAELSAVLQRQRIAIENTVEVAA